jgi:hypothetical protein
MKLDWILRQFVAVLRGVALIVAALLALVLLQLAPSLVRGGVAGVEERIAHVATAGVPPEHWAVAITRMYEALGLLALLALLLFWAQRLVGRLARRATIS